MEEAEGLGLSCVVEGIVNVSLAAYRPQISGVDIRKTSCSVTHVEREIDPNTCIWS